MKCFRCSKPLEEETYTTAFRLSICRQCGFRILGSDRIMWVDWGGQDEKDNREVKIGWLICGQKVSR